VLIFASPNSSEKGRSGQVGPTYIHIVVTRWRSGCKWSTKVSHVSALPLVAIQHLMQVLQLAEVLPGHSIPPVRLGDRVASSEHGEWRVGVVPQTEPYFLPHTRRFRHGEVEVGIDSMLGFDRDVHATQNLRFRA
jgi:hypothetical protein